MPIAAVNRHADARKEEPSDMPHRTLGQRLRQARRDSKLSQAGLAKLAGLKQPSISELESGETKEISGPTMIAICTALKIRPEWLFTGKEAEGGLAVEEDQAIKNLRAALPKWRRYVLSLAMTTDHKAQALFLDMLSEHVPDEKVAAAYGKPPQRSSKARS
jgi:transcriptional regulator with XRE-family HTH domain